jgi:alkanesulfonate monooxygenase SsuD/methylene tetrahydromethanopterin reductase-like flavin-dependent oxidoreductase (luciferase family)
VKVGLRLPEGGQEPLAAVEVAVAAEELGYDSVFLGEHHGFATYWPSPQLVLAAIAARTRRVLVGTNIVLLPLARPVRLAAEVALLDRLSGGRALLGVGLGWDAGESRALGADLRTRGTDADEALTLIRRLWAGGPVDHDGARVTLRGFELVPVPERPPPVWVGGRSEAALQRAALLGDALTADAALTVDELRRAFDRVDELRAAAGRPPAAERPVTRHVVLADSVSEARALAAAYLERDHALHRERGNPMVLAARADDRYVVGDLTAVTAQLDRLRAEAGITHLLVKLPGRLAPTELRGQMDDLIRSINGDRGAHRRAGAGAAGAAGQGREPAGAGRANREPGVPGRARTVP